MEIAAEDLDSAFKRYEASFVYKESYAIKDEAVASWQKKSWLCQFL